MAQVANQEGLLSMEFLFTTHYYRDDPETEVECPAIDALEDVYLEHINPQGFENIWTRNNGWIL
jgi:hypothetical protein